MKRLNPHIDLRALYHKILHMPQKTLLLDYDGTLAPFHAHPAEAYPYSGVPEMLNRIMEGPHTRVVIITGRWTEDLLPLLKLKKRPEVWGSHGMERLKPDGTYEIAAMDADALEGLVKAERWIEKIGLSDRSEAKPGSLAIHWRGLGEKAIRQIRDKVEPQWSFVAESSGLNLKEFDGGLELRVPARDKGDAVGTILRETSRDGVVGYLGDDLTDEDAFKAIKGKGVGVLVRKELRPTSADLWLRPPEELLEFLSVWAP